jgi:hypothetical protein
MNADEPDAIEYVDAVIDGLYYCLACGAARTIDSRRSLAVTEQSILARFAFERVMNQLVAQSGVPGLTSLDLFRQWWDTQNPRPGLELGPHCDDEVSSNGETILNGFSYTCRTGPAEGIQATSGDPYTDPATNPDAYLPIGLFNRFDLARADGVNCGEYRIVYAKHSGITNGLERNLLIFEAALPNPDLDQGLDGCRKIVEFWSKLSQTDDYPRQTILTSVRMLWKGFISRDLVMSNR